MEFNTRNPNEYAAAAANIGPDDENWIVKMIKLENTSHSGPFRYAWDKPSNPDESGLWLYAHDEQDRETAKVFFSPEQVDEIFARESCFLDDKIDINPGTDSYWDKMDYHSAYDSDSDDDILDVLKYVKDAVMMIKHHAGLLDWRDSANQRFYEDDVFQHGEELYTAAMNARLIPSIKRFQALWRKTRKLPPRDHQREQTAVDVTKLRPEIPALSLTLYYNGLDVYSKRHSGNVSVAVKDWWALVCSLNPTWTIHRFQNDTEGLYDIIKTWPQNDATFRRWRNILERYIQKNEDPQKRASFLNSLL